MLMLPPSVKIYLATSPTDMRKGFDGLSALVAEQIGADVYSGHLFVFVSRRADRVKVLTWDQGGFVLYYKRLEAGKFRMPALKTRQKSVRIDASQLTMLLDGIDFSRVRRPIRWQPPIRKGIDTRSDL
jgi:transposase